MCNNPPAQLTTRRGEFVGVIVIHPILRKTGLLFFECSVLVNEFRIYVISKTLVGFELVMNVSLAFLNNLSVIVSSD